MEDILKDYIESQLRELDEEIELEVDDDLVLIGLDSIAYVRMLAFIKNRYDIKIPDTDVTVEQFGTISGIAAYLAGRGISEDGEP